MSRLDDRRTNSKGPRGTTVPSPIQPTKGTGSVPPRQTTTLPDIKPQTPVGALDREAWSQRDEQFEADEVAPLVGMSITFIRKVVGHRARLSVSDVLRLLDQDAYSETFVRRSQVLDFLTRPKPARKPTKVIEVATHTLETGSVTKVLDRLAPSSIQCVVTSTPYWGMRIYDDSTTVTWADGETCAYGHEQTPEGFVRHTVQILWQLRRVLTPDASVWWNLMDSYNTRTQIRGNAIEALLAMQGKDDRKWHEHEARRHSAGHSYLKDGEQCMIPARVAERASRIGYHVKSVITWAKQSSLPEPQNSRVSRGLEYVLHLAPTRTPKFDKTAYRRVQPALGGRSVGYESDKLSDVWVLPTSTGGNGHGAQFPVALPGRCIALSTDPGDVVLDPFVGSGNAGVAARALGRKFIGIDVSPKYLTTAEEKISAVPGSGFEAAATDSGTSSGASSGASSQLVLWPNHTAKEAATERAARIHSAGQSVTRHGNTLTVVSEHHPSATDSYVETLVLAWTDEDGDANLLDLIEEGA